MTATTPQLDLCPACGQRSDSDTACTRCGATLRVDLWLDSAAADPRTCFLAARELAALGLPGADFANLKDALGRPGSRLAAGLARGAARSAIDLLERRGLGASARAAASASPRRRSRVPLVALGLAAALLAMAVGGAAVVRARLAGPTSLLSPGPPAADGAPAAGSVAGAGAAVSGERRLSTQEITSAALGSVVEVACGARTGTAFFVTPERAATNAHVTCGKDELLRIRFHDGRELMGRPLTLEPKLDLAILEVVGAAARPLPLGDSTALAPGDPLVLLGNPQGLTFTAHEAKVGYPSRNFFGTAFVQLNGSVNPGNSGGPLLDGAGRVVGIVSRKVTGADGIGLALPVEYLRALLPEAPPPGDDARRRWTETLRRLRQEDQAEVEKYRGRYRKPTLAAAGLYPQRGLFAVVLRRWAGSPSELPVTIDVRGGARILCSSATEVQSWEPAEQQLERELRDAPDQPRLVWASENRIMRDVFVGLAPLDLGGCALDEVPASAVLAVRGGDESDSPIPFPKPSAVEASARMQEARARAQTSRETAQDARDEAAWRGAFRRVRADIATLEGRRERLRERVTTSLPTSAPNDPRKQLAEVEARLAHANESLQDLERQASGASVPRAWRE
ncbi:MAG TPA: S1C family serine protease [Anaeromyxobacteraceae bacterium]|jgi:S1-C subfamily serine protease|nr:S1C family serine protease [Anaeromyxobacteraceae bacterium]